MTTTNTLAVSGVKSFTNIFEQASRRKLRFNTPKGVITVEDLWDLSLTSTTGKANLDDIARNLHRQLKNGDDVSFVHKERKSDETVQLKFDIVKYVIDVKLAEADEASKARVNAEKKQQLLALIANKENQQLADMPLEDLRKMVESL